ncbi:hypothetical protein TNIN_191991 [Trichonephila inaurata madagascariensis]|uniref:Uncharacterized protein n=1 Tax=Trichonephila inaurata madagascariensis TaxID=2747483 RepID=A0A8X6YD20_9ARAC|nr:hypothetical protein TNIN_191991 [Trichonephila inaurata madagascariensis]
MLKPPERKSFRFSGEGKRYLLYLLGGVRIPPPPLKHNSFFFLSSHAEMTRIAVSRFVERERLSEIRELLNAFNQP